MMTLEAEITDPSRPLLRWRVNFAGPPLPSGLAQAFLSLPRRAWDELDDARRRRLLAAAAGHTARTQRALAWGEHTGKCGRERDTFVTLGPVSQGGELHREVAAALPRSAPLIAYDPIAGAPCEARPPRPTRARPGATEALASSPDGRRVVAFRGFFDGGRAVAQLDAVAVDAQGRDVDDGEEVPADGALPFEGGRVGPFDFAEGRVVVAFGAADARAALGAIVCERVKGFAGVSQCLFAVLRSLESGAADFEGWPVSRLASPEGALAWYASPEQAASLAEAAAAAASQEFWACVFRGDAPALAVAARALLRAATPRYVYSALAGVEVSGASAAEVAAELDRRAPDGDPAARARLYGDALRRVRVLFKRGRF